MEERNLYERHQLLKQQLKDRYFLQRHQLLKKHEKVKQRTEPLQCHQSKAHVTYLSVCVFGVNRSRSRCSATTSE